jgi:hypothetical protein
MSIISQLAILWTYSWSVNIPRLANVIIWNVNLSFPQAYTLALTSGQFILEKVASNWLEMAYDSYLVASSVIMKSTHESMGHAVA